MLTTYQMIACEDPLATESWLSHIHGATALATLRLKDDWNSTPNLRGFLQVWYITVRLNLDIFLSCKDSNIPIGIGVSSQRHTCPSIYHEVDPVFPSFPLQYGTTASESAVSNRI